MMKNYLPTLITGIALLLLAIPQAQACINPDTAVTVIVKYDTIDATPCPFAKEMELRFTNLGFMNESPNKFCACGFGSFTDLFDDIQYVAFVDSGTNNPYAGFAEFDFNSNASQAWAAAAQSGDWSGFVGDVLGSGLQANDPVELVLRLTGPPGTEVTFDSLCVNELENMMTQSSIGTDEWDFVNGGLVASHQSIRSLSPFAPGNSVTFEFQPESYFTQLDADILNNISVGSVRIVNRELLNVYPNPAEDRITVKIESDHDQLGTITLMDLSGRPVQVLQPQTQLTAQAQLELPINRDRIASGLYLLHIALGDAVTTRKITLQ